MHTGLAGFLSAALAVGCGCSGDILPKQRAQSTPAPGETVTEPGSTSPVKGETTTRPAPCTEIVPAPARVIRLSKLELQNTLDALYAAPGPLEVPRDSKAFGFSTGDQQTVNLPFAEGLQRAVEERGVQLKGSLTTFTGTCAATEAAARECAETFLRGKARVAFRRTATDLELADLMEIYGLGRDTTAGTSISERARAGVDYAMRALAQSPQLLYRTELGPDGAVAGAEVELTQTELASALSYTVLAAPPDEGLLVAAAAGELGDPAVRRSHAARLASAAPTQYAAQLERFVTEWLQIDFAKPAWVKSSQAYPGFTPTVLDAVRAETSLTVAAWSRAPQLGALLTSTEGFASPATAGLYGLTLTGTGARAVSFDPTQRAGLLTSPAFLGTHAHTDGSAPILRGVAVMRGVLCLTLPNPPASVPPLPAVDVQAGATTRKTIENHIAAGGVACQGCHSLINPMGFAFEAYDGTGRFRTHENGAAVDTSGGIVGSRESDQAVAGATQLASALASSPEVQRCFARQAFRYSFGRFESAGDRCTLASLEQQFIDEGQNATRLLGGLVATRLFAFRKVQ